MRLLVTRSEPDASEMAAELEAVGHVAVVEPLASFEPGGAELQMDGVQALVATSRNALRAIEPQIARLKGVRLIVVGPGTGAMARAMGFGDVIEGPAAARDLPSVVQERCSPEDGPLLLLAGELSAFDLASALSSLGFEVREAVVYHMRAAEALTPRARRLIAGGGLDGVLLMSPATAQTYATLVLAHGLAEAIGGLIHFCLSPAVAKRLGSLEGAKIKVAARPTRQNMLALVAAVTPKLP